MQTSAWQRWGQDFARQGGGETSYKMGVGAAAGSPDKGKGKACLIASDGMLIHIATPVNEY